MKYSRSGHWHNVTHCWFWWVCKPNNRSNAKTCMSRKSPNRNSRRTWRCKRELPAADVLETSCHDTWPASGMSKSPLRGCHKCHHSLPAPRRGAPTEKNPLIFPDCIRVQKGQTPPSLPPTQRMSRKTKHAKLMEDRWQTLKNVGHCIKWKLQLYVVAHHTMVACIIITPQLSNPSCSDQTLQIQWACLEPTTVQHHP